MDLSQLEKLEERITRLLEAFSNLKDENRGLTERICDFETLVNKMESETEDLRDIKTEKERACEELGRCLSEREIVRGKVTTLLDKIEALEGEL